MAVSVSDITSSFSGFFGGDILNTWLAAIGFGIGLFFVIEIASRSRRGEVGTWGERSTEREVGFRRFASQFRQFEKLEKELRKREKALRAAETLQESKSRGQSGQKAVQAAEEGAESASHQAAAAEATAAISWRTMGVIAGMKKLTRALIDYDYRRNRNILTEEQLKSIIDGIIADISRYTNYNQIDERIRYYLLAFHRKLVQALSQDIEVERQNENIAIELVDKLEEVVKEIKSSIQGARTKLNKLRAEERKERRHFRKELRALRKSMRAKVNELKGLRSKKDADPTIIASLETEIELRRQQLEQAEKVNQQVEGAYSFTKKIMRQMKRVLRYVLANELELIGYAKALEERRKQITRRYEDLKSAVYTMQKIPEDYPRADPHEFALIFSQRIKAYFKKYGDVIEEDIRYDTTVRDITIKNFVMAQQISAVELLEVTLSKTEQALELGVEALTKLTEGILGEASQTNIEEVVSQLQKSTTIANVVQTIDQFMANLAQTIQRKSRFLTDAMQAKIEQAKKLLAQVRLHEESVASHLGKVMATMNRRKIDINTQYLSQAVNFGDQLNKTYNKAGQAYNQAIDLERLAPAA